MKKIAIVSMLMVTLGITIGALLVSNINGNIENVFAFENAKIGAENSPVNPSNLIKELDKAYTEVSNAVLKNVVSISVEAKVEQRNALPKEFYDFFGRPEPSQENGEERRALGGGSGVIITSDGYIVTNAHVVDNAFEDGIKVKLSNKKTYDAKLIGSDPATDLAIIKIEENGLTPAHFADINDVNTGNIVLAVGSPYSLDHTVTSGIISAKGRGNIGLSRREAFNVSYYLQTDAAINPGNSGGGLFDIYGNLVGINTAIASQTGGFVGYGFAVPVDLVRSIAEDIIEDGDVDRGLIGVNIKNIDETDAKGFGLENAEGVYIANVNEGSGGDKAGLKEGDIILEVDGHKVRSSNELQSVIVLHRAGDKVELTIWRDEKSIKKTVTLQPIDGELVAENEKDDEKIQEPVNLEDFGFEVAPLDSEIKESFGIENGVFITSVKRYGLASDRGMFEGGVIYKVGKDDVDSPKHLEDLLTAKSPGEVVIIKIKYKNSNNFVAIEIPSKDG